MTSMKIAQFSRTPTPSIHLSPSSTNYGTTTAPCMWRNGIKTKRKLSHVTFKLTTRFIVRFSPQTVQWYLLLMLKKKFWKTKTKYLKIWNQISYIAGTIENLQTINSGKILFPVYQLKILELTVMAWKSFCKYVLRLWMKLQHKRNSMRNIYPKNRLDNNKRECNKLRTIAYLFYEKQKLIITQGWMKNILLIISNFGEL